MPIPGIPGHFWPLLSPVPVPSGDPAALLSAARSYTAAQGQASTSAYVMGQLPLAGWSGAGADRFLVLHGQLSGTFAVATRALAAAGTAVRAYADDLHQAIAAAKVANNAVHEANQLYYKEQQAGVSLMQAENALSDANQAAAAAQQSYFTALESLTNGWELPVLRHTYVNDSWTAWADQQVTFADQRTLTSAEASWAAARQRAITLSREAVQAAQAAHAKASVAFSAVSALASGATKVTPPASSAGPGSTGLGSTGPGSTGSGTSAATGSGDDSSIVRQLAELTSMPALVAAVKKDLSGRKLSARQLFELLTLLPPARTASLLAGLPATDQTKAIAELAALPPHNLQKLFTPKVLAALPPAQISRLIITMSAKDLSPLLRALPTGQLRKVLTAHVLTTLPAAGLSHVLETLPGTGVKTVFGAIPAAGLSANSTFIDNLAAAIGQLPAGSARQILADLPGQIEKLVLQKLPKSV